MARTTVVIDAANDPRLARDLTAGGAFVIGYDLAISDECDLVVHNGGVQMRLAARVVWINPVAATHGVGLEVVGFGAALRDQLARVIEGAASAPLHLDDPGAIDTPPLDLALGSEASVEVAAARRRVKAASIMRAPSGSNPDLDADAIGLGSAGAAPSSEDASGDSGPQLGRVRLRRTTPRGMDTLARSGERPREPVDDLAVPHEEPDPRFTNLGSEPRTRTRGSSAPPTRDLPPTREPPARESSVSIVADVETAADDDAAATPAQASIHARIRGLNLAEQIKLAHAGDINERIVLERLYGKNVWEPLLRNPRLTAPEVARIARMGALPRVLIEIIVANGGWLAIPDVRRALLTNPRLAAEQIIRILRLMPKPELRLVPTQMQLPMAVREHAKKLLRGEL